MAEDDTRPVVMRSAPVVTSDKPNANGRIYPKGIIDRAMKEFTSQKMSKPSVTSAEIEEANKRAMAGLIEESPEDFLTILRVKLVEVFSRDFPFLGVQNFHVSIDVGFGDHDTSTSEQPLARINLDDNTYLRKEILTFFHSSCIVHSFHLARRDERLKLFRKVCENIARQWHEQFMMRYPDRSLDGIRKLRKLTGKKFNTMDISLIFMACGKQ